MKVRIFTMSLLALCLALFTMGGAMAQSSTTGSIEGTITDPSGGVVPNATVTVSGSNLISPQTATTDDQGHYRILNLPPGRYTVVIGATTGFGEAKQENVEVNLSKTSSADIQMQIAGQSASVTITDTSGATVDVNANTTGTNVSNEQFSNFPTQRTVQSLYSIAPTVTRSGLRDASGRDRDPSVAGSSGPENNYILDGVNTTDPAFGGSGANLPFEFVQEVEIKTGAYGAEYGKSTGGIFNVITKSGSNEFRGDVFGYFTTKALVRETKNFPFLGSAPNGFSEIDAGFDIGGPIKRDKLWFFGAFNPQRRQNYFLTQFFKQPVENKISTPFYSGKLTYSINQTNTFTFSTFGDFTKQTGFLFGGNGFGADPRSFEGTLETGGHNYTARLNSTITPTWIGEFSFGMHFQRANTIPDASVANLPSNVDRFVVIRNGAVLPVVQSGIDSGGSVGFVDYVNGAGGILQRNYARSGNASIFNSTQNRNRYEIQARMQNLYGRHTLKYGFEYNRNIYEIDTTSSGPTRTFKNAAGTDSATVNGYRIDTRFSLCATGLVGGVNTIICPNATLQTRAALVAAQAGIPGGAIIGTLTNAQIFANPFLIRTATRIRDFRLQAPSTKTNIESFYLQDDYKLAKNVQFNFGLRWDYQQAYGADNFSYLKLNNFKDNLQPRAGLIWDFTGKGKGKLFLNYARFLETPLPLDINVRAGSDTTQTDINLNLNHYGDPANSLLIQNIGNLGSTHTPIDPDIKPQTVNEVTAGFEYEIARDLAVGARGIYRAQGTVIEDGSFDDGDTYFLFNPGESLTDRLAETTIGTRFGRARRYYRALEFTATKRFTNNYQFIASYVFSSLIGNYEGLFRNDNGQSDPNITSLFDLVSLLANSYGRLPNDRPHQFKLDGSYRTPFKLLIGGSFRAQSGIPFNALIAHPVYGDNEGFLVPRGTAIVPDAGAVVAGGSAGVNSVGGTRSPTTYNLDLNAYYPIQFGENRQLRLQVDWFNVFNSQRAVTLNQTLRTTSGVTGAAAAGLPDQPNPFYGTGSIFQFPSSLRLGLKFQF
jgi:outer membrane receptor protein involved in Fe transport